MATPQLWMTLAISSVEVIGLVVVEVVHGQSVALGYSVGNGGLARIGAASDPNNVLQ
ncbi:MAG TPA: hypothetical protein VH371_05695 [Candidatus Limnocylindrales bacterium]|jgi:hypothetical protein